MNRYAEYKESGLDWIGEIPSHWRVIPNRKFFREKSIKNVEGLQNLSVYRDYGVVPRDSRDDNHNKVSEDTSHYKLVEVGDFVLNKMKCWMGSLGVSDYQGIVSPAYTVCEPTREINRKYFHYLLRSTSYIQIYGSLSYGIRIAQWELRFHDFKTIRSVYPPVSEQIQISEYLDKETSQIDSLIEKIERKIKLLKEQRTALISQCVTKGLNPNAEMKISGVEWIGEIPSHWEIKKLKRVSEIETGTTPPTINENYYNNGTTPWVKPENLNGMTSITFTTRKLTELGVEKSRLLRANSVLVCGIGTIGKFGFATEPVCTNQQINGITFFEELVCSRFGLYLISSIVDEFKRISEKVVVSILTKTRQQNCSIAFPSLNEQFSICQYLDKKTSQINSLSEKLQRKIELLKEYRQSLISNVVTGKVKVTKDTP